ncbi:MAG: DUF2007 domain-containing protein [Anaerolineales bacterium]|nr:DUF2007 domain-containing protein [Anaerolineales bacterium]
MNDEMKWELLTEVQGRWQADLIKAYLADKGIDSELFQEAIGQLIPTNLDAFGLVQIFVPKDQAEVADKLMKEYFDTLENE